jgi:integrase
MFKKNDNFCLLVNVLMFTGLRPSDIFNLTVDSVDLEKMMLKFYSSKIDKWFIHPIHTVLIPVLEARI